MRVTADRVRAGHRINGAQVLWARPVPDYTLVCVAVEATDDYTSEPIPGGAFLWYRPEEMVEVDVTAA